MRASAKDLTYEEISIGDISEFDRKFCFEDVKLFATLSGDQNPLHINPSYGEKSEFGQNVVHGMLVSSLFSTLVGMYCPGKHSLYLSQSLNFRKPLFFNETIRVRGVVLEKTDALKVIKMSTEIIKNEDKLVTGEARIKVIS